jgi:peptide/nickel transport system ATP-binding protein
MTDPAATCPPALLQIEGLRVGIHTPGGLLRAVDGVDLAIAPGEIVGIVGESGSGKSVMALSVMRLLEARGQTVEGAIHFEGEDVLAMPESRLQQLRGGRMAIVLQDPMTSLNPVLKVGDQLVESILCHGRTGRHEAAGRVVRLLGEMGLTAPDQAMGRYPHQFSGGMRQRIMLAMGFGNSPSLLIADEPTTALDVTIQGQILDLLRRLNAEFGTAIMLITHDLGVVANLCSRIAVMYAGRIVEEGPVEPILADPRHPYTQALVAAVPRVDRAVLRGRPLAMIGGGVPNPLDLPAGCAFQARCPRRVERCRDRPPMQPIGPGRAAACWLADAPRPAAASVAAASPPPPAPDRQAGPLLELRQATKHFPVGRRWLSRSGPGRVVHALDKVSLEVWPGETLGLVGESGSGKSTLARLAVGLSRLTAGEIRFAGQEIGRASAGRLRRLRRDLQMVFQDPYSSLNPRLTVGSAIAEPLRLQRRVATARQAARRAAELLAEVGLGSEAAQRYPHEFSGGQRQRIGIARALAAEPRLIVADEPISSLDVNVQAQILNLLLGLQGEHRLTYVFISHNLAVVRQIAHRIVVLYLGKVVEVAETDRIFAQPLHPYTRALIAAVPIPDAAVERARPRRPLGGEMPSVLDPPSGCRFRTRCPIARPICADVPPPLAVRAPGQAAACHFPGEG